MYQGWQDKENLPMASQFTKFISYFKYISAEQFVIYHLTLFRQIWSLF